MRAYLNCKKIDTAINRATKMLIDEANKNGLYENFGQKEVREIEEKFIDLSNYYEEMNRNRDALSAFNNWAKNYTGK